MRKIQGPKRNALTNQLRIRSNEELGSVIRARRMDWLEPIICSGKEHNIFNIYHVQPAGRRPPGRPRQRLMDNVKRDFQKIGQTGGW